MLLLFNSFVTRNKVAGLFLDKIFFFIEGILVLRVMFVGREGFEPSILAATVFKTVVYTSSTTYPINACPAPNILKPYLHFVMSHRLDKL